MTSSTFFENTFVLRRPGVVIFADIIKIVTILIKKIFKDSRKVKRIRNYVSKCYLYLYFLIKQKCSAKNADFSRTQGVNHNRDSYIFLDLL